MYLPPPRLVDGRCRPRKFAKFPSGGPSLHSISVSNDGDLLALGDDSGLLEIRSREENNKVWTLTKVFTTGAAIRSLLWHPTLSKTVLVGSANGVVHQITVVINGIDIIYHAPVEGFIHAMAMSSEGKDLVIAYGQRLALIRFPFAERDRLGYLVDVPLSEWTHRRPGDRDHITDALIPRSVHFVDSNCFAVTFLGPHPIGIFSRDPVFLLTTIRLRDNSLIGSSALSPSGERLAVFNLKDGIDFYSLSYHKYLSTTRYEVGDRRPPLNLIVGIHFIDEDTVAVGHVDGSIYLVSFGHTAVESSMILKIASASVPIQTLAVGICGGKPLIFGVYLKRSHRTSAIVISEIQNSKMVAVARRQEDYLKGLVRKITISQSTSMQIGIILAAICFAVAFRRWLNPPSGPSLSALRLQEVHPLKQIDSRADLCTAKTSTIRLFHTNIVTITERPTGVQTCLCTVTGIVTSERHLPTLSPEAVRRRPH